MVTRLLLKCKLCDSITLLRYQVGYGDIQIVIPCGNCGCELRGRCTQDDENCALSFSFENAEQVMDGPANFVAQYSRELLSKKVEPYSIEAEFAPSPFISMGSFLAAHHDHDSRIQRAMRFVDTGLPATDDIFDLIRLWENDKLEILYTKLNKMMPECPIEDMNHLQIGTRLHHMLVGLFSPLLPRKWNEEIELFPLISELIKSQRIQIFNCARYFEDQSFLASSESAIVTEVKKFLKIVPNILPAFALCDDAEFKNQLHERGMFSISFEDLKTYYQNSYEVIADCCDCLIALNGIYHRGDFSALPSPVGDIKTLYDLEKSRSKIKKIETFLPPEEKFSKLLTAPLHSHIRNAIGHTSVSYDPLTQMISFEDQHMGKIHVEQVYLTEFAYMCIENFCTLIYLLEIIYQLRKLPFIEMGDTPDANYTRLLLKTNHRKIGRNELCPCGSGKKFKRCCGR